jgi:WD40 repeat protein
MRLAVFVLLIGCSRSDPPEVVRPAARESPVASRKGGKVKSYVQRPLVDAVTVTPAATIPEGLVDHIAFAPDGKTWAAAYAAGVRFFDGDRERNAIVQQHRAAGSIGYSPDGRTLRLGMHDVDAATGTLASQPEVPDLAAWAAQAKLPAPPSLAMNAARKSDDGTTIVVGASGITRDRKHGTREPATGDVDWLIELDGATRKPIRTLWHGRGPNDVIAIAEHHIAVGGRGPVRVFDRNGTTIAAPATLATVIALAWSPGGDLLAAIGDGKTIAVWRTGQWNAPVATWDIGREYQSKLAFHPARPLLAIGNQDGHVRIYGVADSQLAKPPLVADPDAGGAIGALAFSPDGTNLIVAVQSPPNQIQRWTVATKP